MKEFTGQSQLSGWRIRQTRRNKSDHPEIWSLLDSVCDPEIPAISLWDLGVLSDVQQIQGEIIITVTPTYAGHPAIEVMTEHLLARMEVAGYYHVSVVKALSPAWSTDFMTPKGLDKLREYGMAPPLTTSL